MMRQKVTKTVLSGELGTEIRENGPPCKRCGNTTWRVERRRKGRLRWFVEVIVAAPEVLGYGNESGGWPSRHVELWTCLRCGRRVRL